SCPVAFTLNSVSSPNSRSVPTTAPSGRRAARWAASPGCSVSTVAISSSQPQRRREQTEVRRVPEAVDQPDAEETDHDALVHGTPDALGATLARQPPLA